MGISMKVKVPLCLFPSSFLSLAIFSKRKYFVDADMLENIEIGEQKQRDEAYKASKKKGTYDDK